MQSKRSKIFTSFSATKNKAYKISGRREQSRSHFPPLATVQGFVAALAVDFDRSSPPSLQNDATGSNICLVPEMPDAGEYHSDAGGIGGVY